MTIAVVSILAGLVALSFMGWFAASNRALRLRRDLGVADAIINRLDKELVGVRMENGYLRGRLGEIRDRAGEMI
jgi:hypothetical protein